ncbi:unnamed protein product [Arctogadus glacialis]
MVSLGEEGEIYSLLGPPLALGEGGGWALGHPLRGLGSQQAVGHKPKYLRWPSFNEIHTHSSVSGLRGKHRAITAEAAAAAQDFPAPALSACDLSAPHTDPCGRSPRHIKSDSDDDDLPNVTLDSVNETGSTALSIARAVQE